MDTDSKRRLARIENMLSDIMKVVNPTTYSVDTWLTVREASEKLRMSQYIVREKINKGEIPAKKFGKSWKISKIQLNKLINSPT